MHMVAIQKVQKGISEKSLSFLLLAPKFPFPVSAIITRFLYIYPETFYT